MLRHICCRQKNCSDLLREGEDEEGFPDTSFVATREVLAMGWIAQRGEAGFTAHRDVFFGMRVLGLGVDGECGRRGVGDRV
jgi:hypothetical protein